MTNKIYLIYPSDKKVNRLESYQQPYDRLLVSFINFPIDLLTLATISKECGYEPIIKDYSVSTSNIIEDILHDKPLFILANVSIVTFKFDMAILKEIKENCPNIKIIVKGFPFNLYNENAIYENPAIDYIIYGECEETFRELISNNNEKDILGLCYRENFQPVKNKPRNFIDNLDKLPLIDFSLINLDNYKDYNGSKSVILEASRGSSHQSFANITSLFEGKNVRYFSVERIIEQIKILKDVFKVDNIFLKSFLLNMDKNWVENFCENLIKNNIKINWSANFSLNNIDDKLIKLIKKSGCKRIYIFIETCDITILKEQKNKEIENKIKNIIKRIKKKNIEIVANVTFGFPWDNKDTITSITGFINNLNLDFVNFLIATPYPGTKYFYYSLASKLIDEPLDFICATQKALLKTNFLSKEDINDLKKYSYKSFYLRLTQFLNLLFHVNNINKLKLLIDLYKNLQ